MINIDELRQRVAQRADRGDIRRMLEARHPIDPNWPPALLAEHTAWLDQAARDMAERPARELARNAEIAAQKNAARAAEADAMAKLEAALRKQANGDDVRPVIRAEIAAAEERLKRLRLLLLRQR